MHCFQYFNYHSVLPIYLILFIYWCGIFVTLNMSLLYIYIDYVFLFFLKPFHYIILAKYPSVGRVSAMVLRCHWYLNTVAAFDYIRVCITVSHPSLPPSLPPSLDSTTYFFDRRKQQFAREVWLPGDNACCLHSLVNSDWRRQASRG